MTERWILVVSITICFIGNNHANTDNTIFTDAANRFQDIQPKILCPLQSSKSFDFSVKSCKNVIVGTIPFSVVAIGISNNYYGICNLTDTITKMSECSSYDFVQSVDILDCNQFRHFRIQWNSTTISLWKVVQSQYEVVMSSERNNIYIESIRIATFSGSSDEWHFNTTEWNISADFSCKGSTTDYVSTDITTDFENDDGTSEADHDLTPTTIEPTDVTSGSECRCLCEHNPFMYLQGKNLSTEELIEQMRWRLDEIKASLMINKTDTSQYKSKKISVYDNRASSSAIGWFGGVVIAAAVLAIISFDLLRVRQFCTKMKKTAASV